MDLRNFFRNSEISLRGVRVNEDIGETQAAEVNATQVSGINDETSECSVAMATIQRSTCIINKRKWNDDYTAYGFCRTKRD